MKFHIKKYKSVIKNDAFNKMKSQRANANLRNKIKELIFFGDLKFNFSLGLRFILC